jgi:hypothetical protein
MASAGAPVLDPSLASRDDHRGGSEVEIAALPLHRVHANESLVVWDRMASVLCTDEERSSSQQGRIAGLPVSLRSGYLQGCRRQGEVAQNVGCLIFQRDQL